MNRTECSILRCDLQIFHNSSGYTGRIEKSLRIENGHLCIFELFDHRSQVNPQTQSNCEGGLLSVEYPTLSVDYFISNCNSDSSLTRDDLDFWRIPSSSVRATKLKL